MPMRKLRLFQQLAEGVGLRLTVRFSSYSWALARHEVLPVSHGDARGHGCFYGILMESGKSVAAQRGNETRTARTI